METSALSGKEHIVQTGRGSVCVMVCGDRKKPALITYPDLALNHMSCFKGFFLCPEAASFLLNNFCIYHVSPPGHELGAAPICSNEPVLSVDDLADQILEVLNYFMLGSVMCMGVAAGAYVLTLFSLKYKERVHGLILVSPLCKAASWTEWFYNKVMSNLLYYYGMCGILKELLLQRYFSKDIRRSAEVPESEIVHACSKSLEERHEINIWRYLQAIDRRPDISRGLRKIKCRILMFVGDRSPINHEAIHMLTKLDKRRITVVEVQACGSLVTEEQPLTMLVPMESFLMGYKQYRPSQLKLSPRTVLSPMCISPDLLSPECMGLNLRPIKTRNSPKTRNSLLPKIAYPISL